ncbi:hypothetical protein LCGC14_0763520 [marine sediment metagenome]|uniref:Uncharacterized protein n=1 Tax=marine sediment metagenome TaxID=412755 RepID=A0A0F9Q4K9_9ZZZZ
MPYSLLQELTLLERNVANQGDIKKFIAMVQERTTRDDVKKWLKSNLRNWIINFYKAATPVEVTSHSPEWLVKAVSAGQDVVDVDLNDRFRQEVEHTVDYLNSLERGEITRIAVPDAIKQADEWTKRLIKQGEKVHEEEGSTKLVMELPNGFGVVRLITDDAFKREGAKMGHCVGSYCSGFEEGRYEIYSLRDNKNDPHGTIEISGKGKLLGRDIRQIKGRGNRALVRKYWELAWSFVDKFKLKIDYDYENIGLYKIKNKLYPYTKLPKDAKISGNLDLSRLSGFTLPEGLEVGGTLDLHGTDIKALPAGLKVSGSLYLSNTKIKTLPNNLKVGEDLYLMNTLVTKLPSGLEVSDDLVITNTPVTDIPEDAQIQGDVIGLGHQYKDPKINKPAEGWHEGHWVDLPHYHGDRE